MNKFFPALILIGIVIIFSPLLEGRTKKTNLESAPQAESLPALEVNLPTILKEAGYIGRVKMVAYRHGEVMEVLVGKTYRGTWKENLGYTVDLSAYQWTKHWAEAKPPVDILGKDVIIIVSQTAKLEAVGLIEKDKVKFECFRPDRACVITPSPEMNLGDLKIYQEKKK